MAAVQNQDTLAHRLSDEEYKNWLKAALCFFRVKEGLESFVTQESVALHKELLKKSTPCGKCKQNDLKSNTLCPDCEKFKREIENRHVISKPIWNNTNVENWPKNDWSVARCFMNPGQSQHASAADADISALLNFIIFCKVFKEVETYGDIQNDATTVREDRNNLFHRGKDKLKKKDLDDWTTNMIKLLRNETNPVGKLMSNAEAKKALTDIKEILDAEITITLKGENTIKIASLEAQMDEAKTLLQEHGEMFQEHSGMLRVLQKGSTSQGQKVETLMKDVVTIQATIEKIQERMDIVRTRQNMTDEKVNKNIAEMKDAFKSVWDYIQQFEGRSKTYVKEIKQEPKQ